MLSDAMLALRVTDMDYAPEICRLLKAAERDLKIAGVVIEGECCFTVARDPEAEEIRVTDESTITDDLIITAMITYCRIHFGSPPDKASLEASYDLQRRQLANATGYTDFLQEEDAETGGDSQSGEADAGTDGGSQSGEADTGTSVSGQSGDADAGTDGGSQSGEANAGTDGGSGQSGEAGTAEVINP